MSIISTIVGAVGVATDFIGKAVSIAAPIIEKVATKVGETVGKFASVVMDTTKKISENNPEKFMGVFNAIANVIHGVCDFLGISSEEDPAVLGVKAEQAEKKRSDFDDTEAYIDYLREKIELDKEKFDQLSEEQKVGYKALGIALETQAIEDKISGVKISPEYVTTLGRIQMANEGMLNPKDVVDIIRNLKEAGITDMLDVVDYLEGKGDGDTIKTGVALKSAVSKIDDIKDAGEYIESMKQAVRPWKEG